MTKKIHMPTVVPAEGTEPKIIEEYVGRVNTGDASVSIARMTSPQGWIEPAQTPEFDEYTLVLAGMLLVEHEGIAGVAGVLEGGPSATVGAGAEERVQVLARQGALERDPVAGGELPHASRGLERIGGVEVEPALRAHPARTGHHPTAVGDAHPVATVRAPRFPSSGRS